MATDKQQHETGPLDAEPANSKPPGTTKAMNFDKFFCPLGSNPFDTVQWDTRTAEIKDEAGRTIYQQKEVMVPASWSQIATNVVASKYFYGDHRLGLDPCTGGREFSVEQLVHRVTSAITRWGQEDGVFADTGSAHAFHDELAYLCLHQYAAFNSPVWFNVGLHAKYGLAGGKGNYRYEASQGWVVPCEDTYQYPQASACFIQSVSDDMAGIMELARSEAMLFKHGSGTGTDLSTLRSTHEMLRGGGKPSGPVSFMRVYDAIASVIKSGGKTRRAAKMQTIKDWHPDVLEFIRCKAKEDAKARALLAAGYSSSLSGKPDEAYSSVMFQNANLSVRLSDGFLAAAVSEQKWQTRAVTNGKPDGMPTFDASELLDEIAESTWLCGDPGVQYEDTIQRWHTCPNTAPINSSNPCCFVGETQVQTAEGLIEFAELYRSHTNGGSLPLVFAFDRRNSLPELSEIRKVWVAGYTAELFEVRTQRGHVFRCTPEHKFLTYGGEYVQAKDLAPGTRLRKIGIGANEQRAGRRSINHRATPACPSGTEYLSRWIWEQANGPIEPGWEVHHKNSDPTDDRLSNYELVLQEYHDYLHSSGAANPRYIDADERLLVETWEAVEATPKQTHKGGPAVTVARWNAYIRENSLIGRVPLAKTTGIQGMSWEDFSSRIEGLKASANDRVESVTPVHLPSPVAVYDMEVNDNHNFAVGSEASLSPVVVSNSEFMFIDDSACNLASINLLKFVSSDGKFDHEGFLRAVRVILTGQEILVGHSSYPTIPITLNSHRFRPLGLGYANLGAALMSMGLPYDSYGGRAFASAVTAAMHAEAYRTSAELARSLGAFEGFKTNRTPMLDVVRKHAKAANSRWQEYGAHHEASKLMAIACDIFDDALGIAEQHGFRNSQVTVLAPTGTIAFMMDCDTTGVEPDIALVKYKSLAGGGMLKIVNQAVPRSLKKLGYKPNEVEQILSHVIKYDTIEDIAGPHSYPLIRSGLKPEHLEVFDCAFPPPQGGRSIRWKGHLSMMAAVQPFLSGAISKTVNMPADASAKDIRAAYLEGWRLGLKAVAIYRDGSKGAQPVTTKKVDESPAAIASNAVGETASPKPVPRRERLPSTRPALTHKFEVGGHEGYMTVGQYPDGRVGEVFVRMSKEGSTVGGLLDALATAVSIGLQYGIPLEVFTGKFAHARYEPSGMTRDPDVPFAKSLTDYIARWLHHHYLSPKAAPEPLGNYQASVTLRETVQLSMTVPIPEPFQPVNPDVPAPGGYLTSTADTETCPECGGLAYRRGKCHTCQNCGLSLGCS